jgi:ornithine carbamoyltransferase
MTYADLAGKDLITTQDWSREELDYVLDTAKDLKRRRYSGEGVPNLLHKKTFFSLFYNTSTRTRASFETGMTLLGGHAQFIEASSTRLLQGEAIKDVAGVYGRYGDGLGIRIGTLHEFPPGKATAVIREFAENIDVPVINMANDEFHPCQSLTDIMTVQERFPKYERKKFVLMWTYAGKIRTPCSINGDALIMTRYGLDVTVACPQAFDLDPKIKDYCQKNADESGGSIRFTQDPEEALRGAHLVFPRAWTSTKCMLNGLETVGEHAELELETKYKNWKLDPKLVALLDKHGKVMHVMPVYRGLEVDNSVMDSDRSIVLDQAENRLYAQMAILALTMGGR